MLIVVTSFSKRTLQGYFSCFLLFFHLFLLKCYKFFINFKFINFINFFNEIFIKIIKNKDKNGFEILIGLVLFIAYAVIKKNIEILKKY